MPGFTSRRAWQPTAANPRLRQPITGSASTARLKVSLPDREQNGRARVRWPFTSARRFIMNPARPPFLAASSAALPPGGLLVIHDAHLNADKTGPLPVAAYSALLMSVTEGKCYATSEINFETMYERRGWRGLRSFFIGE